MKINFLNNVSFEKRLAAKCNLKKEGKPYKVNIYELSYNEDKDYFENLKKKDSWQDAKFLHHVSDIFKTSQDKFFAMENKKGKCLGYCVSNTDLNTLEYIDVNPQYKNKKHKSKIPHIGETLITFLIKRQFDYPGNYCFYVPKEAKGTKKFYEKCLFDGTQRNYFYHFIIRKPEQEKLISQNKKHNGSEIKLVPSLHPF